MRQILFFSTVGVIGFSVDAIATIIFAKFLGLSPILAKLAAFPFAVTVTWLLNRFFTFRSKNSGIFREWWGFVKVSLGGALINNLSFYVAVSYFEIFTRHLVLGVALGSIFGMMFNFLGSKFYVFK